MPTVYNMNHHAASWAKNFQINHVFLIISLKDRIFKIIMLAFDTGSSLAAYSIIFQMVPTFIAFHRPSKQRCTQ